MGYKLSNFYRPLGHFSLKNHPVALLTSFEERSRVSKTARQQFQLYHKDCLKSRADRGNLITRRTLSNKNNGLFPLYVGKARQVQSRCSPRLFNTKNIFLVIMKVGSLAMSAGANLTIFGPIWSSCMHKCILLPVHRFLWGRRINDSFYYSGTQATIRIGNACKRFLNQH
jgi:hypothetical protein